MNRQLQKITQGTLLVIASMMMASCASLYINSGKKAYEDLRYQDAIWSLEKGLAKKEDNEGRRMLAESYLLTNNVAKANEQYSKVALFTDNSDRDRLMNGQALMAAGQYSQAREVFEGILSRDPDNKMARSMLNSCKKLDDMKKDSLYFAVSQENIPTTLPVYAGFPFQNGLIISSPSSKGEVDPYTNNAFTDLYFTKKDGSTWSNPEPLKGVNGGFHDAVAAVAPNGQLMIFTRSFQLKNSLSGNEKNVSPTQLYQSRMQPDGTWGTPELLPFCNAQYMFAHPAFSPDGLTLYFASDMSGSGGMDIFSSKFAEGSWGIPQNLGTDINTPGNEVFPSVRDEKTLYFSSDGHATLGGLDILSSELVGGRWSIPSHMSYPINSSGDDLAIAWKNGTAAGYFTSDRTGIDRIYSFEEIHPTITLAGMVTGKDSMLPLGGARVTILNLTDGTEQIVFTDGEGKFSADLEPGKDYKIKTDLDGYFSTTDDISTKGVKSDKEINRVVELPELYVSDHQPTGNDQTGGDGGNGGTKGGAGTKPANNSAYPVPNIYWDYNKWDIRQDAIPYLDNLVTLFRNNQNLKFEIQSHCDSRGSFPYNDDLSEKRAKAVVDYLVSKGVPRSIIRSKGFGERQLLNECGDGVFCPESKHQENRRTEFIVTEKK